MTVAENLRSTDAWTQSRIASSLAGVAVAQPKSEEDTTQIRALLSEVDSRYPMVQSADHPAAQCRSDYLAGAYLRGELIGAAVATSDSAALTVESHCVVVRAGFRGRPVGFALKLHQRAWAMERGFDAVRWKFDPLVARNAHFNLAKLAAATISYVAAGSCEQRSDAVARCDDHDQILVEWKLAAPRVVAACGGVPLHPTAGRALEWHWVPIPADINRMRKLDPVAAIDWERKLRHDLGHAMEDGWIVTGYDRCRGYLVAASGSR